MGAQQQLSVNIDFKTKLALCQFKYGFQLKAEFRLQGISAVRNPEAAKRSPNNEHCYVHFKETERISVKAAVHGFSRYARTILSYSVSDALKSFCVRELTVNTR